MTDYRNIQVDLADHIATITFQQPHKLNSISLEFMEEFGSALEQIRSDAKVRVLIVTGIGRGFCSGLDLGLLARIGTTIGADQLKSIIENWQNVFNALEDLPQVTIAAINGVTLGGGVELILCCDFRIASTRAVFGLPEVKLGIIPDLGGLTRLARTVGPAWTKEIALRARNFNAMEALRVGLINRVAEPGDLMGTTRNWAEQFARLSPGAVQRAKKIINCALEWDLASSLKAATESQLELIGTEEFRAAVQAARENKQAV